MTTVHLQKVGNAPLDQGLLNQAVGFFNAASRCLANVAISPQIQNSPMTPGVVCAAFSVELYLKLLNVFTSGNAPRGHKLDELFAPLPADVKSSLGEKYGRGPIDTHIKEC